MSTKQKFVGEYEVRSSPKTLFPYLNTAGGLSHWFADDVKITPEKVFIIDWEGELHRAKISAQKINSYVKLEFLPKPGELDQEPSFIEFKLDTNELTQSTYLKVSDFTNLTDLEEFNDLWDNLVDKLKEIVGG
jgi:uncharacterized protein YndB with AHSA1/START domain